MPAVHARPAIEEDLGGEARVTPLELFFDLVFVFAITQVTGMISDDPTWAGLGRGLLVLAVLWWCWAAYAWLTSPAMAGPALLVAASAFDGAAQAAGAVVFSLCAALIAYEAVRFAEARQRVRHAA
jgi:hypothetical protein